MSRTLSGTLACALLCLMVAATMAPAASGAVDPDVFRSGCGRFQSLHSGDVDGDGYTEILFGTYEGYVVQLQLRAGDFTLEWESPQHSERCWGLVVGDCEIYFARSVVPSDKPSEEPEAVLGRACQLL